ncbi:CPBP family intramembrane glutamic endopeptidase [Arthrobacter sp. B3I4]|uniref:CPBP family intramembrane glutamic endopeptidase n=1 Tax=Arthrobacter sp. B3I4 TaxID=3042267 RepID=UPI0027879AA3|nr:CPBP family intramembrane glutamic endopeptidase [Arthrobacter sp. B3I4]MDQ0755708.1 membrane protease YdiL (CAAX protease family) [Arthrobacter sp. B3I4]
MVLFYVLIFALAFGPALILGGPGALLEGGIYAGTATAADASALMVAAMLSGPPAYALVAMLMIALTSGRAGLRGLRSRTLRWRVGVRWYAVALLTAPLLWLGIQGTLWLTSSAYAPAIIAAEDKAGLLVTALVAGLIAGFFEEIAWSGFATHELIKRHGPVATGLMVGLPWSLLHLPLYAGAPSGDVPWALSVAVGLFAWLPPYRVLMVWVYAHTQSVLIAMLMHVPVSALGFVLGSAAMAGLPDLIFNLIFGVTLWGLVAAVTAGRRSTPQPGPPAPRPLRGTEEPTGAPWSGPESK